jgi:6-phosphogluconate dehydrogenase
MKARLNITIEASLLNEVKKFAAKRNTSVSEMVENYFKTITKPKRKKLSEILDQLPRINIPANKKLSDLYFDAKMKENKNEQ